MKKIKIINKLWNKCQKLKITTKITIMYGALFTLSLGIISVLLIGSSIAILRYSSRSDLEKTISQTESFIQRGGELNRDSLQSHLSDRYVELQVIDPKRRKSYQSDEGVRPNFIERGMPFAMGAAPPNQDGNQFHEMESMDGQQSANTQDLEILYQNLMDEANGRTKEYSVRDKAGTFMLMEKIIIYEDAPYILQAYRFIGDDEAQIDGLIFLFLIVDILGILASILVGRYISRKALQPVQDITETAERISIEDLSQRIEVPETHDEMRELILTFNSMIDRLEVSFKKQNQFISDASHELRTPISVIQGYANLINRWGKTDTNVLQESIDSILAETDHMSKLIKNLLFLAKSTQNRIPVKKERVNLNDLAQDIVRDMQISIEDRQIIYEQKDEVFVEGDYDLLKQLLWIHGENAVKYTKAGGTIHFTVYQEKGKACVSVADDGVGIKSEDQPYIFDRFYRADKARNKEIPGTGLGLAIACWIAESHKGAITVTSEEGKGSIFIDRFPLVK